MTAPHPPFAAEHEAFRAEARAYVEDALRPHAREWEEDRWFPDSVFHDLAKAGYLGLKYEPEWGGSGRGWLFDAVWTEELSRCGSGGVASGIGAHVGIATPPVWKFGTPAQKERWLRPAVAGEKIAALAITEPGAGSDVAGLRTRARREEGGWVVNGAKTYITNGVRADFYVTAVQTREGGGHHGISFLVLEPQPGLHASALSKLGWHASDTGELAFDDVWADEDALLGREHEGFYLIMANFQWERLLMALGAVGSMQAGFERAVESGRLPRALGAELATTLHVSRAITYDALRRFAAGEDAVREVTQAKLATQRACFELHDALLGVLDDPEAHRAARDARLGPIGGGTDEIMREILAKTLGL